MGAALRHCRDSVEYASSPSGAPVHDLMVDYFSDMQEVISRQEQEIAELREVNSRLIRGRIHGQEELNLMPEPVVAFLGSG
jgi:hypothetical protein